MKKLTIKQLKNIYDDETLKRSSKLSTKGRLIWHKEIIEFLRKTVPIKSQRLWIKANKLGW